MVLFAEMEPADKVKFHEQVIVPTERKRKILIIEDDHSTSHFLALRLEKLGYEVMSEVDGIKGLRKAKSKKPDVIILDLMLPRLAGEEICRNIKQDYEEEISSIPVIMLTAKTATVDRIYGKVLGADAYITKPFEFDQVITEINRCLQDKRSG